MAEHRFPDKRILVFAKAPVAGQVKTRMQTALSEQQCLEIYQKMLEHCLQQLSLSRLAPVELWVTDDHPFWQQLSRRYEFRVCFQQGVDLGKRMAHALETALSYCEAAVLIGTDCPYIDADYLEQAFTSLAGDSPIVLGPAEDGGYVLIGLREFNHRVFEGIPWGSDRVMYRTRQQITDLGWSCSVLASLADIDRPGDLDGLRVNFPQLLPEGNGG